MLARRRSEFCAHDGTGLDQSQVGIHGHSRIPERPRLGSPLVTERDDLDARNAATERDLRQALAGVATDLSETTTQVGEYLDHNELGLAFELIVYELDRLEVSPPDDTLERLRSAAERMGRESELEPDSRDAWERLQTRHSS